MRKKQNLDSKSISKKTPSKKTATKKSSPVTNESEPKVVEAEIVHGDVDIDLESLPKTPDEDSFSAEEILDAELTTKNKIDPIKIDPTKKLPAVIEKSVATTDPLTLYLSELRRYPLLSKEQEFEVAKKYFDTKDPESAQLLVKSNLRFVVKIAAEYSKFGSKMIDLIQEGNVGLMHAVREFNPYKGNRLITYAVWWIRGYIQEYLMRQYSMVRIGTTQNQRKLFYQLQKQKQKLDSVDFETNIEAISEKLGIPEDEVRDMAQRVSNRDVNLDKPVDDSSGSSLKFGDLQKDPSEMSLDDKLAHQEELAVLRKNLDELRSELNEREIILLEERILNDEPLTLQEIGEKYGITREAVRQAEVRLMKKIKTKMGVT